MARRTWCAGRAGSALRSSSPGSRRRSRAPRRAASGRHRPQRSRRTGPKSCGTSTWSTTTLNIQIIAVSTRGTSAISTRLSASQRRYGRAYGQNRRKISRTGTGGRGADQRLALRRRREQRAECGRSVFASAASHRRSIVADAGLRDAVAVGVGARSPALPESSPRSCRDAGGVVCDVPSDETSLVSWAFESLLERFVRVP